MKLRPNFWTVLSAVSAVIITVESFLGVLNNLGVHPTLPSGQMPFELLLAFVGLTAFPLWIGYQVGGWRNKKQMAKTGVVKISPPSDFAKPTGELHDLDRAELMTIAQLGWKCLVRHDLLEAKSQLDHNQISGELKPIPFHWWNQTRPELKRQLIDDDDLYNALESFSTALNDRNDRTTLPLDLITDFHIYHKACLVRYEILKRMGFV